MTGREFENQVAWITGGARGIGANVAQRLSALGATVFVSDLDAEASPELPADTHYRQLDVRDAAGCDAIVADIVAEYGRLDIVIANAGICPAGEPMGSDEQWDEVIGTNLGGTRQTIAAAWPQLCQQAISRVVLVSSMAYFRGGLTVGTEYSASKAALIGMTRHLARNGGKYGIRVNAVAPGIIETAMTAGLELPDVGNIPLERYGRAAEVGGPIVFLCSEDANYMTGTTLNITGGMVLSA